MSNALVVMLLGAGMGLGVFILLQALRPRPTNLLELLDILERPGQGYNTASVKHRQSPKNVVATVGKRLMALTSDVERLHRDLAVTERPIEQHALVKVVVPVLVLILGYVLLLVFAFVGIAINPAMILIFTLLFAAGSFFLPDLTLISEANERRTGFRHALSAYLDLVSIIIAGGGGLQTALTDAADAGDGWAFAEIRHTLNTAKFSDVRPWTGLGALGERYGVPELEELAANIKLAGEQGAQLENTVTTKAEVLRSRLQSEVATTAEKRSEQMLIPGGLMLMALFMFIGFAVVAQLSGGATGFLP